MQHTTDDANDSEIDKLIVCPQKRRVPVVVRTILRGHDADVWDAMAKRVQCSVCHAGLPSMHLLDLHVSEAHDAFFTAQRHRGMAVYACLVESCSSKFKDIDSRDEHLQEHHKFPAGYGLERMHLRRYVCVNSQK